MQFHLETSRYERLTHCKSCVFWTTRVSPIENVINLFPDVSSETQELPVDAVESRLQEVSLSRVFTIEQLQELQSNQIKRSLIMHIGYETNNF